MYCKECGKSIPDDSKYCPFCGANLSDVAPLTTKQFDETKNHIDQHRLYGTCIHCENGHKSVSDIQAQKEKENSKPLIIVTIIALIFAIITFLLGLSIVIVNSVIKYGDKNYQFKIAWFIITGIIFLISGGLNLSIIFIKSKDIKSQKTYRIRQYNTFRIVYVVFLTAASIILFVCAHGFIHFPEEASKKSFYTLTPAIAASITFVFSITIITFNRTILNKYKVLNKNKN